ncbi:Endoribonuclease L-PSP [compost metagenome]
MAARTCVLRALSALENAVGDLDNVERILFVRGFVYAEDRFQSFSQILDESSKLLIDVFGERGHHARSALGVAGLPSNGLLELELIAAVK